VARQRHLKKTVTLDPDRQNLLDKAVSSGYMDFRIIRGMVCLVEIDQEALGAYWGIAMFIFRSPKMVRTLEVGYFSPETQAGKKRLDEVGFEWARYAKKGRHSTHFKALYSVGSNSFNVGRLHMLRVEVTRRGVHTRSTSSTSIYSKIVVIQYLQNEYADFRNTTYICEYILIRFFSIIEGGTLRPAGPEQEDLPFHQQYNSFSQPNKQKPLADKLCRIPSKIKYFMVCFKSRIGSGPVRPDKASSVDSQVNMRTSKFPQACMVPTGTGCSSTAQYIS
jgi:hypothetical protein